MKIEDHAHIGTGSVVEPATIGNNVKLWRNCVIVRPFVLDRSKVPSLDRCLITLVLIP